METLPSFIAGSMVLATLLAVTLAYMSARKSLSFLIVLLVWLTLQSVVAVNGFYVNFTAMPPRFLLLVIPPVLLILTLFLTRSGKHFLDQMDASYLTMLHIVRVPVEIVLFFLYVHHAVPEAMTFEGRNLDILSGISAPAVYYFGFVKKRLNPKFLLLWNFVCLALLFNIVITAVLSAPFPFQKIGFEQPNIAVFYFPFVWLPGCIVPLVLFSHLAAIRQILKKQTYPSALNPDSL